MTDDGAATYVMPLRVARARGNVQPDLALVYNSRGGSGLLGVGWVLSGLPRITRCARTYAQDGGAQPVTFTDGEDGDRYCLDGERLVVAGGPAGDASVYGGDQTEYRLEHDRHIKVVSFGRDALGPRFFKAYLKDGRILTLGGGGSSNSWLQGQRARVTFTNSGPQPPPASYGWPVNYSESARYAWALARMEDRAGNFLTARYRLTILPHFGYEQVPESINYTYSDGRPGDRATRSIEFSYQPRPDPNVSFVSGLRIEQTERLDRVEMRWHPDAGVSVLLRSYRLGYRSDSSTKRSLLAQVQECDGSGVCMRATRFQWSPGPDNAFADIDTHIPVATRQQGAPDQNPLVHVGDLDGDGMDDIWYRDNGPGGGSATNCSLPAAAGSIGCRHLPLNCIPPGGGSNPAPDAEQPDGRIIDVNGDARADLIFLERSECVRNQTPTFKNAVYLNLPESTTVVRDGVEEFQPYTKASYALDMNGDGLPELVSADSSAYRLNGSGRLGDYIPTGLTHAFSASLKTLAGNIDGSGRTTLLVPAAAGIAPSGTLALTLDSSRSHVAPQSVLTDRAGYSRPILMDVNGDGLSDWVSEGLTPGFLNVSINTGNGFLEPEHWAVPAPYSASPSIDPRFASANAGAIYNARADGGARVVDYNGDGRQDLLLLGGAPDPHLPLNTVAILLSTGAGFTPVSLSSSIPVGENVNLPGNTPESFRGWRMSQVLDANGDGLDDFIQPVNGAFHVYTRLGRKADLLVGVTDSLGAHESFEHRPVSDNGVYTRGTGCRYPQTCATRGIWLVASHRVTAPGDPTVTASSYAYRDGRSDLAGRGWIGLAGRTERNERTGRVTSARFDNRTRVGSFYPCADIAQAQTADTPLPGGTIRRRNFTTSCQVVRTHGGRSYFAYSAAIDTRESEGADPAELSLLRREQWSQRQDAYGNVVSTALDTYAGRGREPIGRPDGVTTTTTYDNFGASWLIGQPRVHRATSITPDGRRTTRTREYRYDPRTGLLASTTVEPVDGRRASSDVFQQTRLKRNRYGLVTAVTRTAGGRTRTERLGYDDVDHQFPTSATNAAGHTTRFAFHGGLGLMTSLTDSNGLRTKLRYDGFSRLRFTDRPDSSDVETHYVEGPTGAPKITTSVAGGVPFDIEFDRYGRQVARQWRGFDGSALRSESTYDQNGLLASVSYPHAVGQPAAFTLFDYDNLGRLRSAADPHGHARTWTYSGLRTTMEDESHHRRVVTLDALGRITSVADVAGARELTTGFRYGPFGAVVRITGPDRAVMTMSYDRLGRLLRQRDADSGLRVKTYNGFGELTSAVDGNGVRSIYRRDVLGRITAVRNSDGVTTFNWDTSPHGLGMLARTRSPDGTVTRYGYDGLSRVRSLISEIAGHGYAIDSTYDQFGRVRFLSYPRVPGSPRFRVEYEYTPRGELRRVSDSRTHRVIWTAIARNAFGLPTLDEFGNGAVTTRRYDNQGRLRFIGTKRPGAHGVVQALKYAYHPNGDVARRRDAVGRITERFSYDALDRLERVLRAVGHRPPTSTEYTYSDGGNILDRTVASNPAASVQYGYGGRHAGPHAVTEARTPAQRRSYAYDRAGNQVQGGGRTVAYTAFGLPVRITTQSGTLRFRYDALHQRALKEDPSGPSTVYVQGLYERRVAGGHVVDVFHVFGDRRPVAQVTESPGGSTSPHVLFLHDDALASVETVSDDAGHALHFRYSPFGQRRSTAGSDDVRRGFTGHDHDGDLALINMEGRMYDPSLGRFLSPDPALDPSRGGEALNPFSYVRNNPLTYTDPTGFQTEDDGGVPVTGTCTGECAFGEGLVTDVRGPTQPTATPPADPVTPGVSCTGTCGGGPDSASQGSAPHVADDSGNHPVATPNNPNDTRSTQAPAPAPAATNPTAPSATPAAPSTGTEKKGGDIVIIITRDYGAGSHSALFIDNDGDPILYDPGGTYGENEGLRGSSGVVDDPDLSLSKYVKYQEGTGSTVETYRFTLTAEEQTELINRIAPEDTSPGEGEEMLFNIPSCAVHVSSVLQGIGPFSDLGTSLLPGSLADDLDALSNPNHQDYWGFMLERLSD